MKFIYFNGFIIINSLKMWDQHMSQKEREAEMSYMRYNPLWPFGKECSDDVMRKVRWAVRVISNAQAQRLSDEKCDSCTNCRMLKCMIDEHKMIHTILGGSGYTCKRHICVCRTDLDYPERYCRGCGSDSCAQCGSGCKCIDY